MKKSSEPSIYVRRGAILRLADGTHAELRLKPKRLERKLVHNEAETWLEVPLSGAFVATFRIVALPDGALTVGEVRIFPRDDQSRGRDEAGEWSGDAQDVPTGGITTRLVREVKVPQAVLLAQRFLREYRDGWKKLGFDVFAPGVLFAEQGFTGTSTEEPQRKGPGHPPMADEELAEIAEQYVAQLRRGSRSPTKDLAVKRFVAEKTASDQVAKARNRGFLTAAPSGRAGGELTPKALDVLARTKRRRRKK